MKKKVDWSSEVVFNAFQQVVLRTDEAGSVVMHIKDDLAPHHTRSIKMHPMAARWLATDLLIAAQAAELVKLPKKANR